MKTQEHGRLLIDEGVTKKYTNKQKNNKQKEGSEDDEVMDEFRKNFGASLKNINTTSLFKNGPRLQKLDSHHSISSMASNHFPTKVEEISQTTYIKLTTSLANHQSDLTAPRISANLNKVQRSLGGQAVGESSQHTKAAPSNSASKQTKAEPQPQKPVAMVSGSAKKRDS